VVADLLLTFDHPKLIIMSEQEYKPENSEWEKFLGQTKNDLAYGHMNNPKKHYVRPIKHVRTVMIELIQELQRMKEK
jgi:hypothetical protein